MSRYIDADALGKNIIEKYSGRSNGKTIATMALDIINNAPTADVVEVVRCKDCKYYSYIQMGSNPGVCAVNILAYTATEPENYCGYGERTDK